jgi:hypothetical protein
MLVPVLLGVLTFFVRPLGDPLLHLLFGEDAEIRVDSDRRELALGDRMSLTVGLRPRSLIGISPGELSIRVLGGELRPIGRSDPIPGDRATRPLRLPKDTPFALEAVRVGKTQVVATYRTSYRTYAETIAVSVGPPSETGEPHYRNLTGRWVIDGFNGGRGELRLLQVDATTLGGRYRLERAKETEEGAIDGTRDGSPIRMWFLRAASPTRWEVHGRVCADKGYLNLKGTIVQQQLVDRQWVALGNPATFHAFAREREGDLEKASDCTDEARP